MGIEVEIRQPFTKELTKLHKKNILRTRVTGQTMDFKSTIFIFGIALIFILPLVISSPISGEGIYQKKRVIDLEEAFGEESKVRVKRGGKQPGSTQFNLDKNNPRQNKREARKALQHLDALQSKPKEPQLSRLRNAILSIIRNGHT